jgi:hypothetical protein
MKSIPDMLRKKYAAVHQLFSWWCAIMESVPDCLNFLKFHELAANHQRIIGIICSAAGSEYAALPTGVTLQHCDSRAFYRLKLHAEWLAWHRHKEMLCWLIQ